MKETLMPIDTAEQIRERALKRVTKRLLDNGYDNVSDQDRVLIHSQIVDLLLDAATQVISANPPEAVLTPEQTGLLLDAVLASADQLHLQTAELGKSLDRLNERFS